MAVICVLMIFFNAQALITRDEEIAEKTKMKKTLQNKAELLEKGVVILVEKAACFERYVQITQCHLS